MDYSAILKKLYPDGSVQGQCGMFCHKLMQFPQVGDTIISKKAAINKFGYPASKVQGGYDAGDILILDVGTATGHVCFVNNIIGNNNLQLTESNYNYLPGTKIGDKKVHHNRIISKTSKQIVGCIRGPLLFPIPAQKKIYDQKVLVLCSGIPDGNMAQLQDGVQKYIDRVKSKTGGIFTISVDYAPATTNFTVVQQGDGTIFVQPMDVANLAKAVQDKNDKQYDVVCLVYNNSMMVPRPNHPIESPQILYGFNVIEIPLDWISSLNSPNSSLVIYSEAVEIFFAHELMHATYFLANTKGNTTQRDKTHDVVVLNSVTPSPVDYFLQYIMELQPWWNFVSQ